MDQQKILKELSTLIAAGKTKTAFEWLNNQSLDQKTNHTLTIIQSEYKNLLNAERKGTLPANEIQAGKNRIHNKLLLLFDDDLPNRAQSKFNLLKIALPILALLIAGFFFWMNNKPSSSCPTFTKGVNNKILVLPFNNLGDVNRNPQVPLVTKIQELVDKKKLSTSVGIGGEIENLTKNKAIDLAKDCSANVVVWGNYQAFTTNDSTQITLQYHFLEKPNKSNIGETVNLKNLSSLQYGKMFKDFDDAINSLCGVIAMREGNKEVAKTWFNKVKHKDQMDDKLLEAL